MQSKLTIASVALVMAALFSGCRGSTSESPPIHLNPNMDQQWRVDRQEPNDFFPDKRGMRPRVEGTMSHGALADTDEAQEHLWEGRVDGEWTDTFPSGITLDAKLLDRGEERYNIYCTPCHGTTGAGNGMVVQRGYAIPQSFTEPRLRSYPLGRIVYTLKYGAGNMPNYHTQIQVEDRWAIAAYVRALQISRVADANMVPAEQRAGLTGGK
jgi:mono/diheme cytochrome c family protein